MSEIFSQRLKLAIDQSPLRQREIADSIGITAPYLSDLKSAKKSNPSREIVAKLAEILHVRESWLLGVSEFITPTENLKTATYSTHPNLIKEDAAPYGDEKWKGLFETLIETADPDWLLSRVEELQKQAFTGNVNSQRLIAEIMPRLRKRFPQNENSKP